MITLRLDQKLETEIQATATMLGVSKSELIRRGVSEYIKKQKKPNAWELGSDLFGKYASGKDDLSENRKTHIKGKIRAKLTSTPSNLSCWSTSTVNSNCNKK